MSVYYLQIKHGESANVVRHPDETHRWMVDVDHVFVQRLYAVVFYHDLARPMEEWEIVQIPWK